MYFLLETNNHEIGLNLEIMAITWIRCEKKYNEISSNSIVF